MNELTTEIRRTLIYTLACGSLFIAAALRHGDLAVAYGLAFGTLGSLAYLLLAGYRIRRSAALPVKEAIAYMRTGWLIRLSFIVFMLLIALQLPFLNFLAVVAGLFMHQVVTVIYALVFIIKTVLQRKQG